MEGFPELSSFQNEDGSDVAWEGQSKKLEIRHLQLAKKAKDPKYAARNTLNGHWKCLENIWERVSFSNEKHINNDKLRQVSSLIYIHPDKKYVKDMH